MSLSGADSWFTMDQFENDILRLSEQSIDPYLTGNIWLVRGKDRCIVIDTGTGMLSPLPMINSVVQQPLMAIACNAWYDHAGGLHFFSERACHVLDKELITNPTIESSAVSTYCNRNMLKALPYPDFKLASYSMQGSSPTKVLENGEIIDFCNRQLEVIHAPGMTPGSIVLWENSTGSLFTSDLFYDDPLDGFRNEEKSPPTYVEQQHLDSLIRIRDLPVVTVYPGHFDCFGKRRMLDIIDKYLVSL
jgi:glyoxylase-like metal-dependent hydrolase (beta-lactamase superfamily II)